MLVRLDQNEEKKKNEKKNMKKKLYIKKLCRQVLLYNEEALRTSYIIYII